VILHHCPQGVFRRNVRRKPDNAIRPAMHLIARQQGTALPPAVTTLSGHLKKNDQFMRVIRIHEPFYSL